MTVPVFGITNTREANEAATPSNAKMSVVGICMPINLRPPVSTEVFDEAFPLDRLVRLNSNDTAKLSLCDPDGDFIDAVQGVNAQLGPYQMAAELLVVRVEEGEDDEETMANVVGSSVTGTGIHAFLYAGPEVGVYPRLIMTPGATLDRDTGVATIAVTNQGSGYTSAPTVAFSGGGGSGATATAVLGTGGDAGKVVSVTITNPGSGYTSAPTIAFSGGGGTGAAATATVADLANPVCAALPGVLNPILAHAVVRGPATRDEFIQWRETLSSDRLIPVAGGVYAIDSAGDEQLRDSASRVIGIGVRRDYEGGGSPFRPWANQPIYGITGPERPMRFSLTDGATEGQQILAAQGGIIVRGESGDDFAISDGGFVYIGTENLGSDSIWRQYHKVRGRDFIELTTLRTGREFLGRYRLTTQTIRSVLNTIDVIVNREITAGNLLGAKPAEFSPSRNNPSDLRAGHIHVDVSFEEAPAFTRLSVTTRPYAQALTDTIEAVIAVQDLI